MDKKSYIIVKDRHPRISEVLNDCINLCVPTCKDEPLSIILQKICGKLTEAISDISTLETEVDELQADICPDISEDEGNIIECRLDGIFAEVELPPSLRFGVSGEDDTATENRTFNLDSTYVLQINGDPAANTYINVGNGFTDNYVQTDGPSNDGVEVFLEPGNLYMFIDTNSTLTLDGITQDDTTSKILTIDANDDVRYLDKSTLIPVLPTPPQIATLPSRFTSDPGFAGGGSNFYYIGLSLIVAANSKVIVESLVFLEDNGANAVEQFQLEMSVTPVSGGLTYELVGVYPLTATDPISISKSNVGLLADDLTTIANFGSAYDIVGSGKFALRISGCLVTGASSTTFNVKGGIYSGGGAWNALKDSYLKITTI